MKERIWGVPLDPNPYDSRTNALRKLLANVHPHFDDEYTCEYYVEE